MQALEVVLVLLLVLLGALAGGAVGGYLATKPAAERAAQVLDELKAQTEAALQSAQADLKRGADGLENLQLEVQAPKVEWPPILTWLFVMQTVLIGVLTLSNVIDLRKLSGFYRLFKPRKRKTRLASAGGATKTLHDKRVAQQKD